MSVKHILSVLAALCLVACASRPPPGDPACLVTETVLAPILNAAAENEGRAELSPHTLLWPSASDPAWNQIQQMGFSPAWRSGATERALREAYWRAYRPLQMDQSLSRDERERLAWEQAYVSVGDDRVFPEEVFWHRFIHENRRSQPTPCSAQLSNHWNAILRENASGDNHPSVRIQPSAPVFNAAGNRALIAAWTLYPAITPQDTSRETGTIWLLTSTQSGQWRVISARRTDLSASER